MAALARQGQVIGAARVRRQVSVGSCNVTEGAGDTAAGARTGAPSPPARAEVVAEALIGVGLPGEPVLQPMLQCGLHTNGRSASVGPR